MKYLIIVLIFVFITSCFSISPIKILNKKSQKFIYTLYSLHTDDFSSLTNIRANIEQQINLNTSRAVLSNNYKTLESDVNDSLTQLENDYNEKVKDHPTLIYNIFNDYLNDPKQAQKLSKEIGSKVVATLNSTFPKCSDQIRNAVKKIVCQKKWEAFVSYVMQLNQVEAKCDQIWREYHGKAIMILMTATYNVASKYNY